jgi:hypothetical protein
MTKLDVFKFLWLNSIYIREFFTEDLNLPEVAHHFLSIGDVCLQLHIEVGGGLMSYFLLDELVANFETIRAFWIGSL